MRVSLNPAVPVGAVVAGPLLGLLSGAVLAPLGRFLLDHQPFSFFLFRLAALADSKRGLMVCAVIGLVVGIVIAVAMTQETLRIDVQRDGATFTEKSGSRWIGQSDVRVVYREKKDLVVVGRAGEELFRGDGELLSRKQLASAFRSQGWPWTDQDPYQDQFRDWVDGRPELAESAHQTLRERRDALAEKHSERATKLAGALAEEGVVVRDVDGVQQVRQL